MQSTSPRPGISNVDPFDKSEITKELKAKALRELEEDDYTKEECLKKLRFLLKGEKNLYFQDEDVFLLAFLRARKFDTQRAFDLLKRYYHCRKDDLWGKIKFSTVIEVMNHNVFCVLPHRDHEGSILCYFEVENWDPTEVPARELVQALMASNLNTSSSPANQICGYKIIINGAGFTYKKFVYGVKPISAFFYNMLVDPFKALMEKTDSTCYQPGISDVAPFNMREITTELRLKALLELNESDVTRVKCLEELRTLLKGEPNLQFQDEDSFLLLFLRPRKFNVTKAFILCKKYYNSRKDDLWGNIEFSTVIKVLDRNIFGILPHRGHDGSVLFYMTTEAWDPNEISGTEVVQAMMGSDMNSVMSPATQICGYRIIINGAEFTYRKLLRGARPFCQLIYNLVNCFPARYKGIHILNTGRVHYHFWEIAKLLCSQKLRTRIHFHDTNLEDLHKHLSPSVLPKECGGELGPFSSILAKNEMMKFEKQFEEAKKYGYKDSQ